MTSARRVARRFQGATEEDLLNEEALITLADHWADQFFDALEAEADFDKDDIEKALDTLGVTEERLNSLTDKTSGMGDVWQFVMSPFTAIKKLIKSQGFRDQFKKSFRRALSHEFRSTRHMFEVAGRLARGEEVRAPERKAAMRQLVSTLGKTVLLFFMGPGIANLGVWKALGMLAAPLREAIRLVLDKPLRKAAMRLLNADIADVPAFKK